MIAIGIGRMSTTIAAVAFFILMTASCARPVQVGTGDTSRNYSIEVRNEASVAMIVRYNDGRGDALLGSVAAGQSERFIIASPAAPTVVIMGVSEAGSRRSGPHTVNLSSGTPVVILR